MQQRFLREFKFFPAFLTTVLPPPLARPLPRSISDPWAAREAWRHDPYFSVQNRVARLFPGLGLATGAFAVYVAYDTWYHTSGPGQEEAAYWANWAAQRAAASEHQPHP